MTEQRNSYTIVGLRVPELEAQIAELRSDVATLRMLVTAAADALKRVDADVVAILGAMGVARAGDEQDQPGNFAKDRKSEISEDSR